MYTHMPVTYVLCWCAYPNQKLHTCTKKEINVNQIIIMEVNDETNSRWWEKVAYIILVS